MHIIPVIDLKNGQVVLARQGKRRLYQPLSTPLCSEPDILAATRAYLSVFAFRTFYIADLDAIENNGNNHSTITRMLETFTDIKLWIDAGLDPFIKARSQPFHDRVSNVLGSETNISPEQVYDHAQAADCILSLDFDDRGFLGNEEILKRVLSPPLPILPKRLIIMSLACVGRNAGPDLARIGHVMNRLRGNKLSGKQVYARVYAGGGVRNLDDLTALAGRGVYGALLASSLHNKAITSKDLMSLKRAV